MTSFSQKGNAQTPSGLNGLRPRRPNLNSNLYSHIGVEGVVLDDDGTVSQRVQALLLKRPSDARNAVLLVQLESQESLGVRELGDQFLGVVQTSVVGCLLLYQPPPDGSHLPHNPRVHGQATIFLAMATVNV